MRTFEYKFLLKHVTSDGFSLTDYDDLNRAGADGWEVISDTPTYWMVKRELLPMTGGNRPPTQAHDT